MLNSIKSLFKPAQKEQLVPEIVKEEIYTEIPATEFPSFLYDAYWEIFRFTENNTFFAEVRFYGRKKKFFETCRLGASDSNSLQKQINEVIRTKMAQHKKDGA